MSWFRPVTLDGADMVAVNEFDTATQRYRIRLLSRMGDMCVGHPDWLPCPAAVDSTLSGVILDSTVPIPPADFDAALDPDNLRKLREGFQKSMAANENLRNQVRQSAGLRKGL